MKIHYKTRAPVGAAEENGVSVCIFVQLFFLFPGNIGKLYSNDIFLFDKKNKK